MVAHCTVDRLMREHAMNGVRHGKTPRTTVPGKDANTSLDGARGGIARQRSTSTSSCGVVGRKNVLIPVSCGFLPSAPMNSPRTPASLFGSASARACT